MSHLGDDAEAFFQQGDEGTYEGGPKSLSPSTRNVVHEEDDLTTEITHELLERRDRLQRGVKRVIGTLGACVLVLLPFRLGIAAGSSTASAATAIELSTPGAPVAAAAAPASDTSLAAGTNAATPAPMVGGGAAAPGHTLVAREHSTQKPSTVRAPSPTKRAVVRAASNLQHGATRTAAPVPNAPHHATGTRRAVAVHVPPTASFPD